MKLSKQELMLLAEQEEKSYSLHSWNIEQLYYLKSIENHRIIYDGYNYVWECFMKDGWERRSILEYETFETAYAHLRFWIALYLKEYTARLKYIEEKKNKEAIEDNQLFTQAEAYRQACIIIQEEHQKRSEVVIKVQELLPHLTIKELAQMVGISERQVRRILKQ